MHFHFLVLVGAVSTAFCTSTLPQNGNDYDIALTKRVITHEQHADIHRTLALAHTVTKHTMDQAGHHNIADHHHVAADAHTTAHNAPLEAHDGLQTSGLAHSASREAHLASTEAHLASLNHH